MMSTHPEDVRAMETARRLVTCYLDTLNIHEAIREVVATESPARLCRVLYMLAGAVGDTFEDLDDYSRSIVDALADDGPPIEVEHVGGCNGQCDGDSHVLVSDGPPPTPWRCRWLGHRVELNRCVRCGRNLGVHA